MDAPFRDQVTNVEVKTKTEPTENVMKLAEVKLAEVLDRSANATKMP